MLFESAIFACKSLIDAFEKSQEDFEFIKLVLDSVISQPPEYN